MMSNQGRVFKLTFILLLLAQISFGQTTGEGVHFETGLSWEEVKAKAKAENKYIFIDCYATWCGPCKWMSANIFPQKKVGDFMNTHFINVAVQMDKTPKDDQIVKSWYADAKMIGEKYKVDAYPTYLFFAPDGTAVHRIVGTTADGNDFVTKAGDALDPKKQYFTQYRALTGDWKQHKTDTAFLFQVYMTALKADDMQLARSTAEAYLDGQSNLLTTKNLNMIVRAHLIQSSSDKWFRLFLNNANLINDSLREVDHVANAVVWQLTNNVCTEVLQPLYDKHQPIYWKSVESELKRKYPQLGNDLIASVKDDFIYNVGLDINRLAVASGDSSANWDKINQEMKANYPDSDFGIIFLQKKADYLEAKQQWADCAKAAYELMRKYSDQIGNREMNNIAWYFIFLHSDNKKILAEASNQMRQRIEIKGDSDGVRMDTYANLLYKTGFTKKALFWENRAIQKRTDANDLKASMSNLDKMRQGLPTWDQPTTASK